MNVRALFCLFLSLAYLMPAAQAQHLKLEQGDWEFAVSGGIGEDTEGTVYNVDLRLGLFLATYVELGVYANLHDGSEMSRNALGVDVLYLFETETYLLPYLGLRLGYGDLSGTFGEAGTEFYALAGVKYYLADNVSLNAEISAGASTGDSFLGSDGAESSTVDFQLGLSFYW